jgi:hypothetical protein
MVDTRLMSLDERAWTLIAVLRVRTRADVVVVVKVVVEVEVVVSETWVS